MQTNFCVNLTIHLYKNIYRDNYDIFRLLLHFKTLLYYAENGLKRLYCFLHFAPTSRAKACYRLDVEGSLPLPQTQQHVPARAVGNTALLVVQRNQTEPSDHYALIERFKQWV